MYARGFKHCLEYNSSPCVSKNNDDICTIGFYCDFFHIFMGTLNHNRLISSLFSLFVPSPALLSALLLSSSPGTTGGPRTGVAASGVSKWPSESELMESDGGGKRNNGMTWDAFQIWQKWKQSRQRMTQLHFHLTTIKNWTLSRPPPPHSFSSRQQYLS